MTIMRTLLLAVLAAFLITAPVAQAKNANGGQGKGVAARLLPAPAKQHAAVGKKHGKHKGRHGKRPHQGKHKGRHGKRAHQGKHTRGK